jgi:hypothetical protein
MTKFHLNDQGNPGQCSATKKPCPFGGDEAHYPTKTAAREAFEKDHAFDQLSRLTSSSNYETLQKEFATLMADRAAAYTLMGSSFSKRELRLGFTYELNVSREEYDTRVKNYNDADAAADLKSRTLRAFKEVPRWESYFPQVQGLDESQLFLVESFNKEMGASDGPRGVYGTRPAFASDMASNLQETLDRYHAGEKVLDEDPLPSDKLLAILTNENSSIMSQQVLYNILIFPEKDLKPVLDRLGVENVQVKPLLNGRENGLVFTVKDAYGESRSFAIYEHRNTDSLIINGRENWDPTDKDDPLPYAGGSKNEFFAEFGPNEHKQLAETLGYFLKSAQKGELENDRDLVANAGHRDWKAIISKSIPGFGEWVDKQNRERE